METKNKFYTWALLAMLLPNMACEQEELLETPEILSEQAVAAANSQNSPNPYRWKVYFTGSDPFYINTNLSNIQYPDNTISYANDNSADWTGDNLVVGKFIRYPATNLDGVASLSGSGYKARTGSFTKVSYYETFGLDNEQALLGDFDGDGLIEFIQRFKETPPVIPGNYSVGEGKGWYMTRYGFNNPNGWFKISSKGRSLEKGVSRAGDFNGDGVTDIMTFFEDFDGQGNGWYIAFGGEEENFSSWHKVKNTSRTMQNVYIGDFNGDGKDDVFTRWGADFPQGEGFYVTYGAAGYDTDYGPYVKISGSSYEFERLRFGDFDGDGKDDVLSYREPNAPQGRGFYVNYSGGADKWEFLRYAYSPNAIDNMIVGEFNGDGKADIIDTYYDITMVTPAEGDPIEIPGDTFPLPGGN